MMHRKSTKVGILVLFSFLFHIAYPVFSQNPDKLNALQRNYKTAYQDYTQTVSSGASLDQIQEKLKIYFDAYAAYNRAIQASHKTDSKTSPAIEDSKVSSTDSAPVTPADGVAVKDAAAPKNEQPSKTGESWFGKIFNKVKGLVFGKGGKFEMPLPEKILWTIGKSLIPAFGVMATAALLAPLSPIMMIAGGIVVGAALGGLMTYAYEKRMNAKYRETPKEDAKIWRDVTVQGTVEAVMAPFNLATGGLFGIVGPTVGSAIGRVALTQAVLTFTGGALSCQVGGAVKHIWAKYYFHYPEKIAENEKSIDRILEKHLSAGSQLSPAEIKEINRLRTEVEAMRGEDYTPEDVVKDLKRAAISSVISGFAGSVVSDNLYSSAAGRYADMASIKIFGSAAQGKAIAALISTMPVNFVSGMAGASLEKSFINDDILELVKIQRGYPEGSVGYYYYDSLVRQLEEKREAIKETHAGIDAMANNFAVRAAQLTVQGLKHNLFDAPKARQRAIDDRYRADDPLWKKANEKYQKYQENLKAVPDPRNFKNAVAFAKAQAGYLKTLENSRRAWLKESLVARQMEEQPDRVAMKTEIATKFDKEVKLNQMLELARLKGGMAHLEAMKTILKETTPEAANLSEHDLTKLAIQAIAKTYSDKFESSTQKLNNLEEIMKKHDDYKAGKITLTESEAKILEGKRALISPSQYKAALVEKQVYELKADNVRWNSINARMPEILAAAERTTLERYGGSWRTVLTAELYANGLAQYKYNPDGSVSFKSEFKKLATRVPGMVESGVVTDYKTRVNNAIIGSLIPPGSSQQSDYDGYMQSFTKTALTQGTGSILDSIYNASKEKIIGGFSRTY